MLVFVLSFQARAGAALSGTYTICSASCNYKLIGDAIADLNTNGILGPVVFNIYGGNYSEALSINTIIGASATNTITFNGNGKNLASSGSNGTGPTRLYNSSNVIYLNAKYVTIQNMIIEQTGIAYTLENYYSQYCVVNNCLFRFPLGISGTEVYDYYSYKTIWTNNEFAGGSYNVYSDNTYSASYGSSVWANNKFTMAKNYNMNLYNGNRNTYYGNYFDSAYNVNGSVIDNYGNGNTWKNNKWGGANIYSGLNMEYPNYNSTSYPYTVVNNMIGTLGVNNLCYFGIYCFISRAPKCNVHILFNTISMNDGTYNIYVIGVNSSTGWEVVNNNFTNSGIGWSACIYADKTETVDGNNYYNKGDILLIYNGNGYSDLASYQTDAIPNGHGLKDKNYVVTYKSTYDLHLDQSKPAPYGKNIGASTDIDSDSRCVLFPTSGADESGYAKGKGSNSISGLTTVYEGTPSTYLNNAKTDEPKSHAWYLDTITFANKLSDSIELITTSLTKGTRTIKLVTQTCSGPETARYVVNIVSPVKAPNTDFVANTNQIKTGETIYFGDLSTNGPSQWTWKISPATTVNSSGYMVPSYKYLYGTSSSHFAPIVRFDFPGRYQVCLTASNSAGTGNTVCKNEYIEVFPLVNIGSIAAVSYDKGFLYDDGGPDSAYHNINGVETITIAPCADTVYMVLNYFDTWCGYDFMRIYDGKKKLLSTACSTATGPSTGFTGGPVSTFCNGSLPGCIPNTVAYYNQYGGSIDTFMSTDGAIYVEFESHLAQDAAGFEAYWWSKPKKVNKPTAKFSTVDSVCVNKPVSFKNLSSGSNPTYMWDFDGDPSYYEYIGTDDPVYTYLYPGDYKVSLINTTCSGSDTFRKTIHVIKPIAPKAKYNADNYKPCTNDIVYLSTKDIQACIDKYTWTITKLHPYANGKTPVVIYQNLTTVNSSDPNITLPDTGCWNLALKVSNISGADSVFNTCVFNVKKPYCVPDVTNLVSDIGSARITFNDISKLSQQGSIAYQDFIPGVSTTIEIGATYTLSVFRTTAVNKVVHSVYFDWNNDGDFDDTLEHYADNIISSAYDWYANVKVPPFATQGATVMRIAINRGDKTNKVCGINEYGEYEDYRIYITTDHTKPWIKLRGAKDTLAANDTVYIEQGHSYIDKGADAYDNVSGNITAKIKQSISIPYNKYKTGIYKIYYNVKDDSGNVADTKTRVVIETPDKTGPVIQVAKPDTISLEVHLPLKIPAVISAIDSVSGDFTKSVIETNNVDTSKLGVYTITYSVVDSLGNIGRAYRYIKVIDTIAPKIKLVGADTVIVKLGGIYTEPGVALSDNYSSQSVLSANLVSSNNINFNIIGYYKVTYKVTDESGNRGFATRIVKVIDDVPPVITLKGDSVASICRWALYTDAGYDLSDNYWANSTITITKQGSFSLFNTELDGLYSFRYKAVDSSGNTGYSSYRIVKVEKSGSANCISGINGSKEELSNSIIIYPNPGTGKFIITQNFGKDVKLEVSVRNILGQEIVKINQERLNSSRFELDLSAYSAGVYEINILINNNRMVSKQAMIIH